MRNSQWMQKKNLTLTKENLDRVVTTRCTIVSPTFFYQKANNDLGTQMFWIKKLHFLEIKLGDCSRCSRHRILCST